MNYCELHACSAFSFLRGGSFPEQLAEVAAELEMPAIALLDRNGVYGAQRFSVSAREHGVRAIIGAELSMEDGSILPVLVENRTGYKNLCELLTEAHLRSEKGKCAVRWDELTEFAEGLVAFLGSARVSRANASPARTFGILPNRIFPEGKTQIESKKSSRMQNAFASTLQACGPQNTCEHARLLIDAFGRENRFRRTPAAFHSRRRTR